MTGEQQQLLCAAILETVLRSFGGQFSDKASTLLEMISKDWAGNYSANDLKEAIDQLSALRTISKSRFSDLGMITVNWHEARSVLLNESMPPFLNEYARFGQNWLDEMWPRLMSGPRASDGASTQSEPLVLPASDRRVPLDHNSAQYQEVRAGLAELHEELRTANDLDCSAEERDRVLVSLTAAQQLWEAAQLKIVQIEVGIIITIEDAISLLSKVGKAAGKALLIDLISSIVKHATGIEL